MLHLIVGFCSIQINVNRRVRKPERSGEIESVGDVPHIMGQSAMQTVLSGDAPLLSYRLSADPLIKWQCQVIYGQLHASEA